MTRKDRALSIGLIGFLSIVVIAALLYTLLDPAATGVFDAMSGTTSNAEAQGVIDERESIWGVVLVYSLALGGVWIIARSVVESRRGF